MRFEQRRDWRTEIRNPKAGGHFRPLPVVVSKAEIAAVAEYYALDPAIVQAMARSPSARNRQAVVRLAQEVPPSAFGFVDSQAVVPEAVAAEPDRPRPGCVYAVLVYMALLMAVAYGVMAH